MIENEWDDAMHNELHSSRFVLPAIVREKMDGVYGRLPERPSVIAFRTPFLWASACIGILLIGTFVLGFVSPAMAHYLRQLPIVGVAFQSVGDAGIQNAVKKGMATTIGQTVEDKGVAITLDQVIYDGTRISIGLLHDPNINVIVNPYGMLRVNGKEVNASIGGTSKVLDDGMIASVFSFKPTNLLPYQFKLDIIISQVLAYTDGKSNSIQGHWKFATQVVKIIDGASTKKFDPPLVRTYDGIRVAITEVTTTSLTTQVAMELDQPSLYENLNIGGREVAKGEEVVRHELQFQLSDSEHLQLEPFGSSGSKGSEGPERRVLLFAPLMTDAHELTLRVFDQSTKMRSQGGGSFIGSKMPEVQRIPLPVDAPLTVKQGEAGEIVFRNMTFETDQTWVEYEVRGNNPYIQDNAWWIENDKGDRYRVDRYEQTRLRDVAYAYNVKLPAISTEQKLSLAIVQLESGERLEQLDFTIPLD